MLAWKSELLPELEPVNRRPGRIIVLNGTSSSGKSSIAAELQQVMADEYLHLALDRFRLMRPKRDLSEAAFAIAFQQTILGFHRAVAGMAAAGCNVIVDSLFGEQWRLDDFLEVTAGLDVVFVKVCCDLAELNRREWERGDRKPGTAAAQYATVHTLVDYDIEVDSGRSSPRECAERIKAATQGSAFAA